MVKFDATPEDESLIAAIMARYEEAIKAHGHACSHELAVNLEMSLTAVHCNEAHLDLQKLFGFDAFSLIHDINGIDRHCCRNTGKLTNHFLPRCGFRQQQQKEG